MKHLLSVFITISLFSCQSRERSAQFSKEYAEKACPQEAAVLTPDIDSIQTVNLNPYLNNRDFDFGSIVSKVSITKLETTAESIVGNIYKIIVTDSNIYIYDDCNAGSVIIFDREGRFVKRLEHGQGPGELHHMSDMDYDYEKAELCIYQHPTLSFYDRKGNFLRDIRIPIGFYNFKVTGDQVHT